MQVFLFVYLGQLVNTPIDLSSIFDLEMIFYLDRYDTTG